MKECFKNPLFWNHSWIILKYIYIVFGRTLFSNNIRATVAAETKNGDYFWRFCFDISWCLINNELIINNSVKMHLNHHWGFTKTNGVTKEGRFLNSLFYGACFIYSIGLYNLLRFCVHSMAVFSSKSNFITSFSVSWIEDCAFLINIRKMWIIHLQIVGKKVETVWKVLMTISLWTRHVIVL